MSDVFVSYKAEDVRRVRPLVEALEADGYSIWWDEQIGGGTAWRQAIEAELNAAKCVIVAWSKRSIGPDGAFVQDEATRAQQRRVYVPVTIDKVHVPLGFGETQALPLTGWKGDRSDQRYQAVLAAVRRIAGGGMREPPPLGRARAPVGRRTVLAGGAVAVASATVAGGWFLLKPGSAAAADSIAVLPFANLSGDPAQAYFSDGIAEELRSALARVAGLKVVGRTSSEAVRDADAQTASKKLGVPHVLTGSVRRTPSTIRVSAQLIDGRNGIERWSENYDRAPGDAISIQTDIAVNVAQSLRVALGRAGRAALTVGSTASAAAQNLLLQVREFKWIGNPRAAEQRLALVDQAIALDPAYAEAYAWKSMLLLGFANNYSTGSEHSRLKAQALRLANKAIELAPDQAIGHAALGHNRLNDLDIAGANAAFRHGLRLAPGSLDLLRNYNFVVKAVAPLEAVALSDKVAALDPLNPETQKGQIVALYAARRYAEVVQAGREFRATAPDYYRAFGGAVNVAYALLFLGKLSEAMKYFRTLPEDDWERMTGETLVKIRGGDRAGAPDNIQRLQQQFGEALSYQYGQIYAQLGDKDHAFLALNHAWKIKDGGLLSLRIDEMLDPIRGDPRYKALERKLNFP